MLRYLLDFSGTGVIGRLRFVVLKKEVYQQDIRSISKGKNRFIAFWCLSKLNLSARDVLASLDGSRPGYPANHHEPLAFEQVEAGRGDSPVAKLVSGNSLSISVIEAAGGCLYIHWRLGENRGRFNFSRTRPVSYPEIQESMQGR
jgi:hypothetical protein